MELRLPLPQQRLAVARGLQRAATAVSHHHFAQLTEIACGRIEAEMLPRPSKEDDDKDKKQRRRKVSKKSKKKSNGGEGRPENGGEDGEGESGDEEHFASGALGPEDHEHHDEQENEGFVFSPEDREILENGRPRDVPPTEEQPRGQEPQHRPHEDGGMRHRFGQPWPGGGPQGPENRLQRKKSSRHRDSCTPNHKPGGPRREHEHHESHSHPRKEQTHDEKARRYRSEEQHKPHRRKHTHKPSPPTPTKKEKLTWKVLLRGFLKGIAAYETNELKKRQTSNQSQTQASQPPTSRPRRKSEPTNRPRRSPSPTSHPDPSRPRTKVSSSKNNGPSPGSGPSRGRPGLRHASSDDLPPLTPGQIHWREVRAREQGQEDIMRAEQEAAAAARRREQEQRQAHKGGEVNPLACGKNPFTDPIPTPSPEAIPRNPDVPETAAATTTTTTKEFENPPQAQPVVFVGGWSFPADLAVSPQPIADPTSPTQVPAPPVHSPNPLPPKWGDPIEERGTRKKQRK